MLGGVYDLTGIHSMFGNSKCLFRLGLQIMVVEVRRRDFALVFGEITLGPLVWEARTLRMFLSLFTFAGHVVNLGIQ